MLKPVLSNREREIARLASEGLCNKDIAAMLGLSPQTVKNCLSRVFLKLGISRRRDLAENSEVAA